LNVEAVKLVAVIIRNSKQKPKGRRWNFEEKILALSLLKPSPKSCSSDVIPSSIRAHLAIPPQYRSF